MRPPNVSLLVQLNSGSGDMGVIPLLLTGGSQPNGIDAVQAVPLGQPWVNERDKSKSSRL
jgi:hypothetical protein